MASLFQDKTWTEEDLGKLITLIRINPCLWDSRCDDNKNYEARSNALTDIAKKFDVTRNEIRRKYRNLRTQYIRELRNSQSRGYESRWVHFNSLKFLSKNQDVPNAAIFDTLNSDDTQEEMLRQQNTDNEDSYVEEYLNEAYDIVDSEDQKTGDICEASCDGADYEKMQPSPIKKRRNIDYETDQSEAEGGCSRQSHESTTKRSKVLLTRSPKEFQDEYTVFGQHVANELRILKDKKHLQNNLKCDILQAIIDVSRAANNLSPPQ